MSTGELLDTVKRWGVEILALFASILGLIEHFLRQIMGQAGVPAQWQSLVMLVVAVLFILAVLRVFGGVFRVLLVLFLVVFVLHVLLPGAVI